MARILVNYADRGFADAQRYSAKTALEIGGFDGIATLGRRHLDEDTAFVARNRHILDQPRGAGYWLWKPYIVDLLLRLTLKPGDMLFYCDSGAHFVAPVDPVIELCRDRRDLPVLLFTLEDERSNRAWTKRDCFVLMDQDTPDYTDAPQILASFLVCERTRAAMDFIAEWLRLAQDYRLITDADNECGLPNYPEFREHRHDQSILSLLGRKHGAETVPDISQWGNGRRPADIPQIIAHTRWRG